MVNPLSDVDEAWTFAGIGEKVSNDSLSVELYGANNGYMESKVTNTRRTRRWYGTDTAWDYEVHMPEVGAGGDSGAPIVHDDALVAQYVGLYRRLGLDDFAVGTAADETLDAVDASLYIEDSLP